MLIRKIDYQMLIFSSGYTSVFIDTFGLNEEKSTDKDSSTAGEINFAKILF